MRPLQIKDDIYWVGAVDWDMREFHGYATPFGSTYNAVLVKDESTVLFDTVKKPFAGEFIHQLSQVVEPMAIDYIVVNHVEMDHTGSLPEAIEAVRPKKVFCSANGKKALLAHFHREDWPLEVVANGETLNLGKRTVRFQETRMLHWPDSMFSYLVEDKILISQDAFGQHWATNKRFDDEVDHEELMYQAATYYANILLPYSNLVKKLLADVKTSGMEIEMIIPDHGLIWRSNVGEILAAYDKWSRQLTCNKAIVVFDTMWHSTKMMANAIAEGLNEECDCVRVFNLQGSHRSEIMTDVMDAKAVVVGSSTLNNGLLPSVADFLTYMVGLKPANKIGGAFGSYGWGGEATKLITASLEDLKFTLPEAAMRVNYVPDSSALAECMEYGRRIGRQAKMALENPGE